MTGVGGALTGGGGTMPPKTLPSGAGGTVVPTGSGGRPGSSGLGGNPLNTSYPYDHHPDAGVGSPGCQQWGGQYAAGVCTFDCSAPPCQKMTKGFSKHPRHDNAGQA